ncbi:sugar-binding domain-containing protein [uncultured Paludibaculum sp.]|uniref:glycosyl hydrolase 2 galactose-binding domain-containing protein n=1 Tax=uncultured Paludibaculum sp. TaxID=1765020 RepID=UPI002AABE253|nr:sugar-binding domain-containing protein [uncultured Paludibaculum sp.]
MRLLSLIFLAPLLAHGATAGRVTVSLNGDWHVGESVAAEPIPGEFGHVAPVPGLTNLAQPAFPDVDRFDSREFIQTSIREKKLPESARVETAGVSRQTRNYFWYRRTFTVPGRKPVAMLRVAKAQFGTAVWLNGKKVGEHLGCFTAGYFDVTSFVNWSGENDLVIRIGAHPAALPVWAPAGTDFEKYKWTPGIYDNVSLILTGVPYVESVQVGPRLSDSSAVVETVLVNLGSTAARTSLVQQVKPWAARTLAVSLQPGERKTVWQTLPLPGAKLWTPEEPNLHWLDTASCVCQVLQKH